MNTNQVIIGTDGQQCDLNGLQVSLRGTTAYKGVSYMSCWQFGGEMRFVAVVGLSKDECKIANKQTFMFHLSAHDNVLDAAWVVMKFNEDRAENVKMLNGIKTCEWNVGQMPVFKFEALEFNGQAAKTTSKPKTFKARVMKPKMKTFEVDNRSADKFFEVLFAKYDVQALVKKFGRDVVLAARKALTINEFEMRFGL